MILPHRALADKQLLGAAMGKLDSWRTWVAVLKAAFAVKLNRADRRAFEAIAGSRQPPSRRVKELWAVIGRRSGKSRIAAAIAVWLALFSGYQPVAGETPYVLVLSASKEQAKTVWRYCLGFLQSSPVLAQEIDGEPTATEIRLRNGVVIAVHAGSFRTVRGRSLIGVVFDEVAYWRDESSAMPDIETYRAVLPALASTNGLLVGISSPYRKIGLLHQKWRDHFNQDGDEVLVVQGDSRTFNPTLEEDMIALASANDPEAALAEWGGQWRNDISSLLDDSTIDAAIGDRPLELPFRSEHRYVAFTDASAGRHDAFTVCIAHAEGDTLIADVVRGAKAPFDPDTVAKEFAALAKSYRCSEIVGDNFAGEWTAAAFKKAGIRYTRSEKPRSELYLECIPLFARELVNIPNHAKLIRELRLLERHTSRAGRDRVDHGRNGSDDYANAVCGALRELSAPRIRGSWGIMADGAGRWFSPALPPPQDADMSDPAVIAHREQALRLAQSWNAESRANILRSNHRHGTIHTERA